MLRSSGELDYLRWQLEQLGIFSGSSAIIDIGASISSGTVGSVLFVGTGPALAQDNSKFFWDDSSDFLGIGTDAPTAGVHIKGNSDVVHLRIQAVLSQSILPFVYESSTGGNLFVIRPSGGFIANEQGFDVDSRIEGDNDQNLVYVDAGVDHVGIGTSNPQSRLEVLGRSDEVQFRIVNNATQTTFPFIVADSSGNNLFQVRSLGGIIVNNNGEDSDSRFSGNTDVNLLFVDAGADRVGIGTNAPGGKLEIVGTADEVQLLMKIYNGGAGQTFFPFLIEEADGDNLFYVNPFGGIVVNEQGYDTDSRMEGDTDANLYYLDASTDRIGIGTATPATKLDVNGVINAATGYRIANAAASGHVLKGNGTNYVDGEVAASEITSGAALTKTDDTNVTLTLGGSPTSSLLAATSLTLGWTGTLAISRGGTGAGTALAAFDALSPLTTRGDLLTRDATNNIRLAIGVSGRFLKSDGTDASWGKVNASDVASGAILSKVDDTNVTLSLGGSPLTALLADTSITVGWTGQLALSRGGTGAALLDPNADRIMFWDDSAGAVTWLAPSRGLAIDTTNIGMTDNGYARAYRNTGQTISSATLTKIQLSSETYDIGSNFDSSTNYRYTVPTGGAGKYLLIGQLGYGTPVTGLRFWVGLYVNGAEGSINSKPTGVVDFTTETVSNVVELADGDYVELYTYHTFGANRDTVGGPNYTFMCVVPLGT